MEQNTHHAVIQAQDELAAAPPKVTPSKVTQSLVAQLLQRDAHGQQKYGTSMDRPDLTLAQWLQHQVEELLDGAGYAAAALRELSIQNQEYALFRKVVETAIASAAKKSGSHLRGLDDATPEGSYNEGVDDALEVLGEAIDKYDIDALLRQLGRK